MAIQYIAVDVEASGPTPANYSLLSVGACVVGQSETKFYKELKPISSNYSIEAMKVGCLELRCLDYLKRKDSRFNARSRNFRPDFVLQIIEHDGVEPAAAFSEFREWILGSSKGKKPFLASDCVAFDGMYIHFYFDKFGIENPFGYGGLNINSMYKGFARSEGASLKGSNFHPDTPSHNALEDAVGQARALEKLLKAMRKR